MLNASLQDDSEKPESNHLEIDNSLFEESEPTSFSTSLDGIAQIDPMGACLLNLLSKTRPFAFDTRIR
jgi:hypothetical protein